MKEIRKKVFLSYASEDKNTINLIFNELQKNQIKVCYDIINQYGKHMKKTIRHL